MTDKTIEPRGVRCNNPFNIRKSADKWVGLADLQTDPAFCTFEDPAYGIRAGVVILLKYFDRYGLNTVHAILNRFAPPVENDTGAYAYDVAKRMKVGMWQVVNLHDHATMLALAGAIVAHECSGYQYPPDVMEHGLAMAGIRPAP